MEYLEGRLKYCYDCKEKEIKGYENSLTWIDGRCKVCSPKPPSTDVILAMSFQQIKSMNSHLTFYTFIVIINLIGLLLLIFGVIEL